MHLGGACVGLALQGWAIELSNGFETNRGVQQQHIQQMRTLSIAQCLEPRQYDDGLRG